MTEVRVVLSGAGELAVMDVAGLEAELGGIRRVRARLDGHEARLLSALTKARQRAANRKGKETGTDTGSEDEAGPPAPSRKAQREAEARSQRLATNPDVAEALEAGDINSEQADYLTTTDLPDEIKARLLTEAMGQSADETRAAVREAEREQTSDDPEERLARQRRRRRGSCGIDGDDMIWFNALLDPVTGAALKAEYDRRERAAFHHDMRTIRDPRQRRSHQQRGADVIASMLTDGLLHTTPAEARGSVNLIVDIDQLERPDGLAYTIDGAQVRDRSLGGCCAGRRSMLGFSRRTGGCWTWPTTSSTPHQHKDSPWPYATAHADGDTATPKPNAAKPTICIIANTAERPTSTTWRCCAHTTTTDSTPRTHDSSWAPHQTTGNSKTPTAPSSANGPNHHHDNENRPTNHQTKPRSQAEGL